jgi:4-hydroxy-tetrahydrodipicolinate reductase
MSKNAAEPRIVIYGVGQFGSLIARFAVQKGWPIVAAFNRAGPKVGRDLGRVVGLDRDLGVIIQDCETGDYEALRGKADIGLVTQTNTLRVNLPAYRRLLGAGLNVGCHGSQSYLPHSCDPVAAKEIEQLALRQGVTFTGSGIWDMSRIWAGILTAAPCTEIKSMHHSSMTDPHGQAVSLEQARQIGIGGTVEEFHALQLDKTPLPVSYKTIPEHVLIGLGYTLTDSQIKVEPVVFDVAVPTWFVPEGSFAPGVVLGTRMLIEVHTREGVTATASIETRMFKPGDVEHMFWSVEGKPRTRMRVERDDSAHATAATLFNRVPDIIAAQPGIQSVYRLGPLKSTALR